MPAICWYSCGQSTLSGCLEALSMALRISSTLRNVGHSLYALSKASEAPLRSLFKSAEIPCVSILATVSSLVDNIDCEGGGDGRGIADGGDAGDVGKKASTAVKKASFSFGSPSKIGGKPNTVTVKTAMSVLTLVTDRLSVPAPSDLPAGSLSDMAGHNPAVRCIPTSTLFGTSIERNGQAL